MTGATMCVSASALRVALTCAHGPVAAVANAALDPSSRNLDVPLPNIGVQSREMAWPANNKARAAFTVSSTIPVS